MTVTVSTTLIHEVGIDYLSEIKMTVTVSTTPIHEVGIDHLSVKLLTK